MNEDMKSFFGNLEGEVWLPLPGHEEFYSISNLGRVKSHARNAVGTRGRPSTRQLKILKQGVTRRGYLNVAIAANGKAVSRYVHHLVLITFVGPRPDGMEACHGDGNPSNNALPNLRWDTPVSNASDRVKHGTASIGEAHGKSKLTEAMVVAMRASRAKGTTLEMLSTEFHVSVQTIRNAVIGRTWGHVKTQGT